MSKTFKDVTDEILRVGFLSATLSSPVHKEDSKVSIKAVSTKNGERFQITSYKDNQAFHKNYTLKECVDLLTDSLPKKYRQGVFKLPDFSYHVLVNKKQEMTVLQKREEKPNTKLAQHNRVKTYLIPEGIPVPFLVSLGVMSEDGKVYPKKYDKFRQINRFLELIESAVAALPKKHLQIVDFGCGKSYLTFALYHYLKEVCGLQFSLYGLDLKKSVIEECAALAKQLGYQDLHFSVGDIHHFSTEEAIDLVISLHACDTATDAAIAQAVRWDAKAILCVPCCQHELFEQVKNREMETLLRQGILKERFSALLTDAVRVELLSMQGYDTQIMEFIDMEHTPKNLLIRAVKSPSNARAQAAKKRYEAIKAQFHLNPSLENLLQNL